MSADKLTLDAPTLRVLGARGEDAEAPSPREHYYLMVFHGETSTSFALPRSGTVLIGRSDEAHLRIDDHGVSRRHATLTMEGGEARLADLGSHNGVWVGGERVVASRVLLSGDTVTIGGATLVYHASGTRPLGRRALDFPQLRQRLVEEVERAAQFSRDLAVVVVLRGTENARTTDDAALAGLMRRCDIVGRDGGGDLVVLLPETGSNPAAALAALTGVLAAAPKARAGLASYPLDGADPDALLAGARAAASAAAPGAVALARDVFQTLKLGGREVVVADPAMLRLFAFVERIATADLPVLITGETGTGKELVASAIHAMSRRSQGPFVVMSCAALPEQLLEAELFGCGSGVLPGGGPERPGRLEAASGGTLFLDEIGELSATAQARLLRAIEARCVVRLGETHERTIDLRVVAATNHAIEDEVQAGVFRRDLYFRLTGAKLWLPPLRDRPRELPILAQRFLAAAPRARGAPVMTIAPAAMRVLAEHSWPGNVRELRHVMEYVAAAYVDEVLQPHHLTERLGLTALPPPTPPPSPPPAPASAPPSQAAAPAPAPEGEAPPKFRPIDDEIRELEVQRITAALAATRGNQTRASELIGMPLRTFINKLKRYGIAADRRS